MTTAGENNLRLMETGDQPAKGRRHATLILINVCVGQFIVGLDQRALLVALPTLTHSFNTSLSTIQWVLLIYDLVLIGLVITVGRLGDLFGRRRFTPAASCFLLSVRLFAVPPNLRARSFSFAAYKPWAGR